jgi:hypothetical protein
MKPKAIKNHLWNENKKKTYCGIELNQNLHLADIEDGIWYDSYSNPIGVDNWKDKLCFNCMKLHDMDLINHFNSETFFSEYRKQLPKSIRAARLKNAAIRMKRIGKPTARQYQSVSSQLKAKELTDKKAKPIKKKKVVKQTKPIEKPKPIKQSKKAIKRKERKLNHQLKKRNQLKTDINKLASKYHKPIEQKPKTVNIIETVSNADNWKFGDPIKDNSICELILNDEYKLIRKGKLNQWQFVRTELKGKKRIDYIESDFMPYREAVELANELIFV